MKTRFADIPAIVQSGSVFETFSGDEIPALAKKFYALFGKFHGAIGDRWLQILVDIGPEAIKVAVDRHQQEFRARPGIQAIYDDAAPHARSVIDRFATVAAGLRMAIEAGLLPWTVEDADAGIEACVVRWDEAQDDDDESDVVADPIPAAIAEFMVGRQAWQGSATELSSKLNGAATSAESLGHALRKRANRRQLKESHIVVTPMRDDTPKRNRIIRIEKIMDGLDGLDSPNRPIRPAN